MNLTPTADQRIFETQWIPYANALIEVKYYYAKVDDLLFYVRARRGISFAQLKTSSDEVESAVLGSDQEYEDNSRDQFNKLVKYLNTPVK